MPRPRKTKTASEASEPKPRRRVVARSTPKPAPDAMTVTPVPADEVAAEAYFLFLARGGQPGDALADWLTAEQIVKARRQNGARS